MPCIVLHCAKDDAGDLQKRIMNTHENAFDKGVEYIPYTLSSVWSKQDYVNLFHQQNQYTHDTGAIAIQGVLEAFMEKIHNIDEASQQYFLTHKHILSLEKLNHPNKAKWWIFTKEIIRIK